MGVKKLSSAFVRRLALVLTVAAMISATGCSKDKKGDEGATPDGSIDSNSLGDSDSGKAMGLQTIFFPYDSFVLTGESKAALKSNAQIMKDKTSLKIQVEGHCDDRGGIQYNIALGEKRANAVKAYLADLGVKGDRVSTISYGEEKPLSTGSDDAAYAKNRRANFVVTSR